MSLFNLTYDKNIFVGFFVDARNKSIEEQWCASGIFGMSFLLVFRSGTALFSVEQLVYLSLDLANFSFRDSKSHEARLRAEIRIVFQVCVQIPSAW